jgi:hypothetical protein
MGPLDRANLNHWTDKPEEEVIDSSSIVGPRNLLPEDGDRSSLRNVVFCPFLDKIGTMDIVQNHSFNYTSP